MHRHARNYTNYSLDEITSGLKRDLLILTVCIVYVLTKNDVDAFFHVFLDCHQLYCLSLRLRFRFSVQKCHLSLDHSLV